MNLSALWARAGAASWGTCAYRDLLPWMDAPARARAEALCPRPAGVYVAAFPYYPGAEAGNLSLYARGEDYHLTLPRRLSPVRAALQDHYPGRIFIPLADNSPLPERAAAALAGIGLRGKNTLTILPPWGSWVFLATLLTDLPLPSAARAAPGCMDCGACVAACPAGALSAGGLDPSKCLSSLTQRKGGLTAGEAALLRRHPLIWGCDICQQVCPYNRDAPLSPLPEFREALISTLTPADVEHRTRRQFQEAFPRRAFTWRGPAVLSRNLALQAGAEPGPAAEQDGKNPKAR